MRRIDRALALLLGLAVAGAAVITGIEAVLLVLGRPSLVIPRARWAATLSTLHWGNTTLLVVGGALTAGGVALVGLQVLPRRRVRLLLRHGAHAGTWLSRKGLARKVAYEVGGLPGVSRSSARISRRRVRVRARLRPGIDRATGQAAVAAAAAEVVGHWPLAAGLLVKVRVRATRRPPATTTAAGVS